MLIAAHRAAQARFPQATAQRRALIHGQFLREDQVDCYKTLGVIPSLFPMHTFYWGDWHRDHTVGPGWPTTSRPPAGRRARHDVHLPPRRAGRLPGFDAGAGCHRHPPVAVGRHRRPGPPRRCDHCAEGDDDLARLPVLRGGTKGTLETGKLADLVILSKDPTKVDPTTIANIKVVETIKEGKTIFRLEPSAHTATTPPDITPMVVAFGGHRGLPADGCSHDALLRLTTVMAGGPTGR